MFKTVNRNVIIISPKNKLIDWVNYIFSDDKVEYEEHPFANDYANVYLVPEKDNIDDTLKYLEKHFLRIFEEELFNWCTDENLWPNPLTWKLFQEWFHISVQTMIYDLSKQPLIKEIE